MIAIHLEWNLIFFAREDGTIIAYNMDRKKVHVIPIRVFWYGRRIVGVFGPPMSKFVFARLAQMVCSEDTRVYTGLGRMFLCLVCSCSCYRHLVCNRGYKQAREGKDSKSPVKGVNGC